LLQSANDLGGVRAKLLNRDTMFRDWNNNMLSDKDSRKLLKNNDV